MSVKKTKAAYIAGIMDGEGSFTISYSEPYNAFIQYVGFNSTDVKLTNWAVKFWGGSSKLQKRKNAPPNARDIWRWRIHGHSKMEKFLLAIIPYLVIKIEQAKIMLEFVRMHRKYAPEKRLELVQKIQSLNVRGKNWKAPETNTPKAGFRKRGWKKLVKIESELASDGESVTPVMVIA
jgi:hypothetical protein